MLEDEQRIPEDASWSCFCGKGCQGRYVDGRGSKWFGQVQGCVGAESLVGWLVGTGCFAAIEQFLVKERVGGIE